MDNVFNVTVPDDELERPAFEPLQTGPYTGALKAASRESNDSGWEAVRLVFNPVRNADGRTFNTDVRAQFTVANPKSPEAVRIGVAGLVAAAAAFGLTEPSTTADGKTGQRLVAQTLDELVEQFRTLLGTEAGVYVKTAPRKPKPDGSHLKRDGTPWMDSEIKRVSAISAS